MAATAKTVIVNIVLKNDPNGGRHARPEPATIELSTGDTVTYHSAEQFEVVFAGSPFSAQPALVITDSTPLTVTSNGRFLGKCFIIKNGERIGWRPFEEPPELESGGDHDVKP